jgi:hypothetical protein
MAYRYNSWKHSLRIEYNEKKKRYEICLYSAYSGRKLKIMDTAPTYELAKILASCITDHAKEEN